MLSTDAGAVLGPLTPTGQPDPGRSNGGGVVVTVAADPGGQARLGADGHTDGVVNVGDAATRVR